jgi:hypothetical protein
VSCSFVRITKCSYWLNYLRLVTDSRQISSLGGVAAWQFGAAKYQGGAPALAPWSVKPCIVISSLITLLACWARALNTNGQIGG